jgi:ElaB/YqjD/DUF883 family membrane-anchored ribosome-binding protein
MQVVSPSQSLRSVNLCHGKVSSKFGRFTVTKSMASVAARLDDALNDVEMKMQQLDQDIQSLDPGIPSQTTAAGIEKRLAELESRLNHLVDDIRRVELAQCSDSDNEITRLRSRYSGILQEFQQKKNGVTSSTSDRQREQAAANARRSEGITENLATAIRLGNETITTEDTAMRALLDDVHRLEEINRNIEYIEDGDMGHEAKHGLARAKRMLIRVCYKFLPWIIKI